MTPCLFSFDKKNTPKGAVLIGTDEAGRGPAAGGVWAAAVYFANPDKSLFRTLNDSKKLTEKKREYLFELICQNTIFAVETSSVEVIEKINILQASLLTMKKACEKVLNQCKAEKSVVLIDGNKRIPNFNNPQTCIVKGDSLSASIAAASILAKVERDRYMLNLHEEFPHYGWAKNKGYLTKQHIEAIKTHGATAHHRQKFLRKILL